MQAIIERAALVKALGSTVSVVEARNTIPILSNVMLHADSGKLTATATNLDIEVTTSAEAQIVKSGSISVAAKELNDIAKRAPEGSQIQLVYDKATDPRLKIKAGRSNYTLPVIPAADFPIFETTIDAPNVYLPGADLARMIAAIYHATSREETRYYLNGGFLHRVTVDGANLMRMVATDGLRLALADMAAPEDYDPPEGVIVPNKTLDMMRKLVAGVTEDIELAHDRRKIMLRVGETVMHSKLIDGSFPDYGRVVPTKESETGTAAMKAQDLSAAIDAVGIVSHEKSRAIKFNFDKDGLTLSVRSMENGDANTQVDIEHTGDALEVGFNGRLVNDVMAVANDRDIVVHFSDSSSPTRITLPADPGLTFVVMPLRV